MRNLLDVIAQMQDAIPELDEPFSIADYNIATQLLDGFSSIKSSLIYAAPETYSTSWDEVGTLLSSVLPDPSRLNGWQQKIVDIFTDKK